MPDLNKVVLSIVAAIPRDAVMEIILVVLILAPRVPICTEAGLGAVQISVQRYIPMVCMYVRYTTRVFSHFAF